MRLMLMAWTVFSCLALTGCSVDEPSLGKDAALAATPRSGRVFLVRGLLGIFSTGMDDLREKLQESGIAAVSLQHTNEKSAARLIAEHPEFRDGPLVIVGHSLGAGAAVELCDLLAQQNITVDLLITLDPISADRVPPNVRQAINYYRSGGVLFPIPLFRGVPLRQGQQSATLRNVDLNKSRGYFDPGTNHFNIDTSDRLQKAILHEILAICPPADFPAAQIAGSELAPAERRITKSQGVHTSQ